MAHMNNLRERMESTEPKTNRTTALVRRLWLHVEGRLLSRYLRLRHVMLLRTIRPLALYLEAQVFPNLKQAGSKWLILHVDEAPAGLRGVADKYHADYAGTEPIARRLQEQGVRQVRLDTGLEYGQVVEAMLILLYAGQSVYDTPPCENADPMYSGWRRAMIASRMRHGEGLHRACAIMRMDTDASVFTVEYSYCELLLSRAVTRYVQKRDRFRDHRVLLHAAPWAALVVFFLAAAAWYLARLMPVMGEAVWFVTAAGIAVAFGGYTHAIGAVLYAREHFHRLVKSYAEQVRTLSRFPEASPDIAMEIKADGSLNYLNPTGHELLAELNLNETDYKAILPDTYNDMVAKSLQRTEKTVDALVVLGERVVTYSFSPFPDTDSVIVTGKDVTDLKRVETELRDLNERVLEKNRKLKEANAWIDHEMEEVAKIQRSLLPAKLPEVGGLDLAVYYQPSSHAGGDYYDFFPFENGKLGLLLADVSGHGTPAAVMAAIVHSMAHLFLDPDTAHDPGHLLDQINDHIVDRYAKPTATFVTAFFGVYDARERRLAYACAGHDPPRLCRKRGGPIEGLDASTNIPLGVFLDQSYATYSEPLCRDDVVVFYTDGITEAKDAKKRMFGLERFDDAIRRSDGDANQILGTILAAVDAFTAGHPPNDDRALLVMRVQ